ncbi:uncharacterized protein LOC116301061 [Actinia tenebrosa]|uniref:Uncharacterized protein LOC116301061 n=1 Tax=Actinia tenebrosa TaxID=6105 RepID=A0A6P8IGK6_ACTTE|nr:uncharacterized protein LOC116301061 [Actinia tenebrosa]
MAPKGTLLVFLVVLTIDIFCESPGDCNFDRDYCNWVNDKSDNFDWLRRSGSTPTLFTGPSKDHTSGKGFYIYNYANDASDSHKPGDKAKLLSPSMRGPKCMTFYYNMYGQYMSCFLVYIKVENSTQYLAWIKSGDRGDRWIEAQVFINETGSYQVVLEVIQNWSWSGHGAIDDISFHNGSCEQNDDIFYVSKKYDTEVLYKVGTMPQYGDWKNQFSFTARKTTGALGEPMHFIYPSSSYGYPLITSTLRLEIRRFPLDFFYDSALINTSSVFYVLQRGGSMSEQISTVNSSYEHCCSLQGINSFNAVPVEDNIASKLPVNSSSATSMAFLAVDGNPDTCYYSRKSSNPWLSITLPKTAYVHRVKITNYKGCCNIPYASMEVTVERTLNAVVAISKQCGNNQPFSGDVLSRQFKCRPPIFGSRVFIRLHGDNVTLVLCRVTVAAFDSVDEAKGVHRQIWYKLINTQGMSSIRENIAFNSVPHGATLSRDFGSQFEVADNYGEMLTSFLQVPLSGNYTFHLSCGDECELWINEFHENGLLFDKGSINSDVGQLLVRIQKWASYNDSLGCVTASTTSKIYLTKCRIYEMKLYVKEGSSFQCLAVGMTTPNGNIEHPIKNKYLFWMQPGQRILTFTMLGPTVLEADLGETVSIKARYTFCCHGIHCPNCSLTVDFHVFGKVFDVSRSLKATCEEHLFSVQLDAVVQPGIHEMKILYTFTGTPKKEKGQRTVGQINVKVAVLQNETFTKGFGKWSTDSQPSWKTDNSSDELYAFIDGPYSSNLESPVLPWKQFYSQVGLCIDFSYLMPKPKPATLKIFLNITGIKSQLLWSLSGFHGNKWKRARVSWQAKENSLIVIRGESSVNAISVAIDTVTITTEACKVRPSYAFPGFTCNKDEFQCANGHCISNNQRCDNDFNCLDNSDEIGCKCLVNELTCPSGKCVKSRNLCDGTKDCENGLDEKRCGKEVNTRKHLK